MEESEKRRERLRAMRAEAEDSGNSRSFPAPALSNPLTEVSPPGIAPISRFDFYTDPMSAFTRNSTAAAIHGGPTNQQMFRPRGRGGQNQFPHAGGRGGQNQFPHAGARQSYSRGFNGGGQGRGRSWGVNGGGRGVRSERFYSDSMVEDPWKLLEPVVWAPRFAKSWAPTPEAKKARVSDASNKVDSQPSLAQYLAVSFSEAEAVADDSL